MKLAVFSNKQVWKSTSSPSGYATDGGFSFHMAAISELFEKTEVYVPVTPKSKPKGEVAISGKNLSILPLGNLNASGIKRKLVVPFWFMSNILPIWQAIRKADAIHVPIPSDFGTIAMILANWMGKPLFVRHCGNWFVQRTAAERFWKSFMEKNAGGKNVMLATGGHKLPPSSINPNIKWIFSTSLRESEIKDLLKTNPVLDRKAPRLIIACRQEKEKGTEKVLGAIRLLKDEFPGIHLDVLGDGSYLPVLKELASDYSVTDKVTFHGKADHDGVLKALQKAAIFTFPTSASEGFPKAVLEAMAAGLGVIATRVSVLPDLLGDGNGILLDDNSEESVAAAIRTLIKEPGLYESIQHNGRELARSYTLENWSSTIGKHLKEAWGRDTKA